MKDSASAPVLFALFKYTSLLGTIAEPMRQLIESQLGHILALILGKFAALVEVVGRGKTANCFILLNLAGTKNEDCPVVLAA